MYNYKSFLGAVQLFLRVHGDEARLSRPVSCKKLHRFSVLVTTYDTLKESSEMRHGVRDTYEHAVRKILSFTARTFPLSLDKEFLIDLICSSVVVLCFFPLFIVLISNKLDVFDVFTKARELAVRRTRITK